MMVEIALSLAATRLNLQLPTSRRRVRGDRWPPNWATTTPTGKTLFELESPERAGDVFQYLEGGNRRISPRSPIAEERAVTAHPREPWP